MTPRRAGKGEAAEPDPLTRLEAGLSALVRWNESKHIRTELAVRSGHDLPPSEWRLLEHFDLAAPMRISDVADCLRVDVSTVSLQLRQLRRLQLVEAVPDPRDRRATLIAITPAGRSALATVRAARRELLAEVFAAVPPEELGAAADVLLVVQDHMLAGMRGVPDAVTTD
ncbi:hypothetical protein GCM10010168_20070 [Actinoplanes ianthinogenes]|uniref:HTH marR-type domain-containing protein n=1 Tax=Actinoplanes ianthinogenes TaxID=122358 RepID=A0ABN6CVG8_9ACTN|nr:hypothetical protein Aiant_83060 [Actinoplanes ianthinogenes]GGR03178.1 hypothetical protein GCM10010168_20070 [Actinoplanes ianthinogenes]